VRQNAVSNTATAFTTPPIHTAVLSATLRTADGRSGLKVIASTANAGGSATMI